MSPYDARFNANVVLKSITLIGGDGEAHPRRMSVFKNRSDIDFANVERLTPTQTWDLSPDPRGDLQYPTRSDGPLSGLMLMTQYFTG